MIVDLIQIRRLGENKREENLRFRKYLKSHEWVERQFRRAATEIQAQIDCQSCAECCRVTEVQLADRDIERLARFLRLKLTVFLDRYTATGEGGEKILKRNEQGCIFLSGNECTIYESRPGNCEHFPHLLKGSGSIPSRMWQFVDRATYCPIVYNWLEAVKALTGFRK